MNKFERENIRHNFTTSIKTAWTFERLTEKEQENILELLDKTPLFAPNTKGVYEELHNVYYTFIAALGYKSNLWRETKGE